MSSLLHILKVSECIILLTKRLVTSRIPKLCEFHIDIFNTIR